VNAPKGAAVFKFNGEIKMKNTILTMSGKLLLGFAVGILILVTAQAKTLHAQELSAKREKIGETLRRQHWKPEKSEKSVSIKNLSSGGLNITKGNQNSFDIGQRFALAVANTTDLGTSEQAYQYMLVDLVELIDKSEGKPEAVQLQKILKSVIRKTANGIQIKSNLEMIAKAYQTKQSKEQ